MTAGIFPSTGFRSLFTGTISSGGIGNSSIRVKNDHKLGNENNGEDSVFSDTPTQLVYVGHQSKSHLTIHMLPYN
jgi:hypothetical protein